MNTYYLQTATYHTSGTNIKGDENIFLTLFFFNIKENHGPLFQKVWQRTVALTNPPIQCSLVHASIVRGNLVYQHNHLNTSCWKTNSLAPTYFVLWMIVSCVSCCGITVRLITSLFTPCLYRFECPTRTDGRICHFQFLSVPHFPMLNSFLHLCDFFKKNLMKNLSALQCEFLLVQTFVCNFP